MWDDYFFVKNLVRNGESFFMLMILFYVPSLVGALLFNHLAVFFVLWRIQWNTFLYFSSTVLKKFGLSVKLSLCMLLQKLNNDSVTFFNESPILLFWYNLIIILNNIKQEFCEKPTHGKIKLEFQLQKRTGVYFRHQRWLISSADKFTALFICMKWLFSNNF